MLLLLLVPLADDLGSVAKFLRGGGGGGDDVAVLKCKERRHAGRRATGDNSGG